MKSSDMKYRKTRMTERTYVNGLSELQKAITGMLAYEDSVMA